MPSDCTWEPLYACVHLVAEEKEREEGMGDGEEAGVWENPVRGNKSWGGGMRGWGRQ